MALSRKCSWYMLSLLLLLFSFPALGQDEDYYVEDDVVVEDYTEEFVEEPQVNQQDEYLKSEIEPKPFDRATWNKNREGMGYGEKPPETKPKKKEKTEEKKDEDGNGPLADDDDDSGSSIFSGFAGLGTLVQILLIGGVIVMLAFLVFLLVKQGWLTNNKKIAGEGGKAILLEDIEDNLHESDLARALRMALEANDYRMAIRIYYLTIIKELSSLQWIHWKRDKTNGQYVREMSDRPNFSEFRQLTIAFDRVWYSDEVIAKHHYEVLSPQFESFINSLKKR